MGEVNGELETNMDLVDEWIDDITNYQQLSVKTRRTYITDVKNAARIFGENGTSFTELRKEDLKQFLQPSKKKPATKSQPRTPESIFSALNSMMNSSSTRRRPSTTPFHRFVNAT